MDYWGLSYKENIEFLLDYHKAGKINLVMAQGTVIDTNWLLFKCSISRVIILATEECLSGLRCGLGKLVCGNAP